MGSRIEQRGDYREVPVAKVKPNGWNYNVQNEATFTKLDRSMKKFGFIEPVIVRQVKGGFEIINGEHRWRAAKTDGLETLRVIDVGKMSDEDAKQLCVIFNELSGNPDEVRLAEVLRSINAKVPTDELLAVMPYSSSEMDMYLNAVDFSFDNLPTHSTKTPEEEAAERLAFKLGWEGDEATRMIERLAAIAEDPKEAVDIALSTHEAKQAAKKKRNGSKK